MDYHASPFHRFPGWKTLALIAVTLAYTIWFTTIGPYGALSELAPGLPLEDRGYYTGAEAVKALSALDAHGQRAKYVSLLCDIPYMILNALLFEALIAFGIRRMKLTKPAWSLLFICPILFLFVDFTEDSFIALTLATGSETLGTFAGIATAAKFITFTLASLPALLMGLAGLIFWLFKKVRS